MGKLSLKYDFLFGKVSCNILTIFKLILLITYKQVKKVNKMTELKGTFDFDQSHKLQIVDYSQRIYCMNERRVIRDRLGNDGALYRFYQFNDIERKCVPLFQHFAIGAIKFFPEFSCFITFDQHYIHVNKIKDGKICKIYEYQHYNAFSTFYVRCVGERYIIFINIQGGYLIRDMTNNREVRCFLPILDLSKDTIIVDKLKTNSYVHYRIEDIMKGEYAPFNECTISKDCPYHVIFGVMRKKEDMKMVFPLSVEYVAKLEKIFNLTRLIKDTTNIIKSYLEKMQFEILYDGYNSYTLYLL